MSHPTFGEEDKIHGVPPASPRTAGEKVQNFWYHYKWHSIFALFLAVVVLIVSLQMCAKEEYDIYVMYAGPAPLSSSQNLAAQRLFEELTPDFSGNGKKSVAYTTLYIQNPNEIIEEGDIGAAELAAQSQKNYEIFQGENMTGTYKLCLFSPTLFKSIDDAGGFLNLTEYVSGLPADKLIGSNKTGIPLSALPIYEDPVISFLPADTVVAIRSTNVLNQNDKGYRDTLNHVAALQAWVNYTYEPPTP